MFLHDILLRDPPPRAHLCVGVLEVTPEKGNLGDGLVDCKASETDSVLRQVPVVTQWLYVCCASMGAGQLRSV